MKTLVYTNTGLTSKQIGLNTEVLEKLKNEGKELKLVLCDNVLKNCYFNRSHNVLGCASCQSRQMALLQQIGITKEDCVPLKKDSDQNIAFPTFSSLEELLNYDFNGIAIGRGAASSIISYTRDYHLTSEKYGDLIEVELQKSITVLLNFERIIKEFQPDEIYLFNGRFAEVWPLLELTKKYNIPYYCIEAGSQNNYELFDNSLPHSIDGRELTMRKIWANSIQKDKVEVAQNWFESKRNGSTNTEIDYTGKQHKSSLPENFDKTKINIAFMNSSEDELKAINEWEHNLYNYQNQAITQIVKHYSTNSDVHFYLRVHPNLGKVDNIQIKEINEMSFPNLTIIEPFSEIDSYALMEACDKVIAFGSTAGIEATYWGKPSILYGKAFYMNFDVTYNPASFRELTELIETPNLNAKPKENTYTYAYYWTAFGTPTKHFKFDGLENSTYKNKKNISFNFLVLI